MRRFDRRYRIEFLSAMAAYTLVMLFVWPRVRGLESLPLRALGALAPMVPLLAAVRAIVRRVLAGDELELRVHLVAASIAACAVGVATMAAGFLAAAQALEVPGSALVFVFPGLVVTWGLALAWARRRYGMGGGE